MTSTPFLTLNLRGKKDAVLARQRARRVASILNFDSREQTCIAAGTFVVACQALLLLGRAKLCFQLENQHLQVFAEEIENRPEGAPPQASRRLAGYFPSSDSTLLFRLAKPLPARDLAADEQELGWLVNQVETTACHGLFDEIAKQNQEVLSLLGELRLYQQNSEVAEEKIAKPNAA
ncbi:MAG: hypothetical protein HYX68_03500 [Planctomycetes bacterium]|nr:hypothetical protein [Planctomycetota bacterium]